MAPSLTQLLNAPRRVWQGVSALGEGPVWVKWAETAGSVGAVETDSVDGVETGLAGGALKVSRRPNPPSRNPHAASS